MPKFIWAMTGQFPSPLGTGRYSILVSKTQPGEPEKRKERRAGESAGAADAAPARGGGGRAPSGQRKRPGPLAGRGCWAARLPGSQRRSRVSAAANLGEPRGGDSSATPRPAEEPGARQGRAVGGRRRDPPRPARPPPWPRARRLLRARPRPRGPCGRTGALPPPGMLRGASAAFPGRRSADTRPRPGREGGRREEGGGRGRAAVTARLARLRPRRSAPPCSAEPPARTPSPGPPTGLAAQPSTPTPGRGRPARIPKDDVSIWDPQQVPGKQSRSSRPPCVQPPAEEPADSLRERGGQEDSGKHFFQPGLWHVRTQVTLWQRELGRARVRAQGTSRGWGGRPLQVARRVRA